MGFPPQQQPQPGIESNMTPRPIFNNPNYKPGGKLLDKVAIVTGGDSGIGRAIAIAFAKEGAHVVMAYLHEESDAHETKKMIKQIGRHCTMIQGDVRDKAHCQQIIKTTFERYQKLDILVNNAGVQYVQHRLEDISEEQLRKTFETNIFAPIFLSQAALPLMGSGSAIINTVSIVAYIGLKELIDYSATKGALVSFTRSLSESVADRGIRVNAVAPGPIWTPLIPASFTPKQISEFGDNVPMGRAGQPYELAPAYVYLASDDSSYVTGQVLHVNGGVVLNG